jgi:hypothetical protein
VHEKVDVEGARAGSRKSAIIARAAAASLAPTPMDPSAPASHTAAASTGVETPPSAPGSPEA